MGKMGKIWGAGLPGVLKQLFEGAGPSSLLHELPSSKHGGMDRFHGIHVRYIYLFLRQQNLWISWMGQDGTPRVMFRTRLPLDWDFHSSDGHRVKSFTTGVSPIDDEPAEVGGRKFFTPIYTEMASRGPTDLGR